MFIQNALADTDTIEIQEAVAVESVEIGTPSFIESIGGSGLVPMVLIFLVFYFLLIRPQEKKRRMQEQLVLGVKKGEEIVTNAGLFGTVTEINDSDNTIVVQIAKGVEIKMLKNYIADIISRRTKEEKKEALPNKKSTTKKK